jgi:hypothetical protein
LSQFEFVQVTIAVILGLGLTDLLRNLGEQYRHRNEIEIYWLQIAASCLLLIVILMYLWNFWRASDINWTLPLFLLQVASAVALALSAQFIKVDCSSDKTAETQYFDNRTATFVSWGLAPTFAGFFQVVTEEGNLAIPRIGVVILLVFLAITRRPIVHMIVISVLLMTVAIGLTIGQFELS